MRLYVGCKSTPENPNGLHLVDFDGASGRMKIVESYRTDNPLYLAKSADGKFLYATQADGLGSFAIGPDGRLTPVDSVRLGAKAMCHVALMPGDGALAWAAYSSAEAGLMEVRDGRFLGDIRRARHTGSGPNVPRQAAAHCHEAVPTPDGHHVVVVDLGTDSLVTYSADYAQSPGVAFKTSPAGAGPRHVLFHPDGRHAFVVFELGNRVASYAWDEKSGFCLLDSAPTLPDFWHGYNLDAAIRFTPDGRRVVVSNRGFDSLTVFDFDLPSGKLTFRARSALPGSWPRDFAFMPCSDFAVVANEHSNTLLAVRYDRASGVFTPVDSLNGLFGPVAVLVG